MWDGSCDLPPHGPWSSCFQPVRLTDFHLGESWPIPPHSAARLNGPNQTPLVKFYKTVRLRWVCFVLEVKAFHSEPVQTAQWFCASIRPTPRWSNWIQNLWRSHVILKLPTKTHRLSNATFFTYIFNFHFLRLWIHSIRGPVCKI